MTIESLYRRIMGQQLDDLPESLRALHDIPVGVSMEGTFNIQRGRGWFRRCIAALGRLPNSGTDVPMRLEISVENGREIWHRQFGSDIMQTVQWQHGDLLLEAGGPMRFGFRIATGDQHLELRLERTWFCRIPLPRFLRPIVAAQETATANGVAVKVSVAIPFVGEIIRYDGQVSVATSSEKP
jgi:hypothetical protein